MAGKRKPIKEEQDVTTKKIKKTEESASETPKFKLKKLGKRASLSVQEDQRIPFFLHRITLLLEYGCGDIAPRNELRWCEIEYNQLSHIIVLLIEGLSLNDFQGHESLFPAVTDNFKSKLELITPIAYGGCAIKEMARVPLLCNQKHRLLKQYAGLNMLIKEKEESLKQFSAIFPISEASLNNPDDMKFSRKQLILSPSEMAELNFPLPFKDGHLGKYKDYVLTKEYYHEVSHKSPMFSLDTEMCHLKSGALQVTKVALVNEKLEVVYSTSVKPRNIEDIKDYKTRRTGLTQDLLHDVNVTLDDVQNSIKSLLPPDAILVGHSLDCDLRVLKMMHPYVIDTSIIFNSTGNILKKPKLSKLAETFLCQKIQRKGQAHCPVEDSVTCMKLTQLKLANNPESGVANVASHRSAAQHSQMQVTADSSSSDETAISTISKYTKTDHSAAIVGCEEVIDKYSSYMSEFMISIGDDSHSDNKAVKCFVTENEKVASQTGDIARENFLTVAHIQVDRAECDEINMLKRVNIWCQAVWESIANNGMCVVILCGKQQDEKGACFIQVKQPPKTDHVLHEEK